VLAVIEASEAALLPVAGAPLLARQLQWLRGVGCERVEVRGARVARWLQASELAMDVGELPRGLRHLVVPGDVLGNGDLARLFYEDGDVEAHLHRPFAGVEAATVSLAGGGERRAILGPGWGMRVRNAADALRLGAAVLTGRLSGIQVHAAERAPGVWVARGAHVERGATVTAPVFIGAGALVRSGAVVGPCAFIGERSVVEAGARIVESILEPALIAGAGVVVERAVASEAGLTPLAGGRAVPVEDPLLLAPRGRFFASFSRVLFPEPRQEPASARATIQTNFGSRAR
jgi:hypothetical protein